MNTEIKKAKQNLINIMCEEAKKIMQSHKGTYSKIGWVDYITDDLTEYQFTAAYISVGGKIVLVEKDNDNNNPNLMMHQVDNIERLEWILKGLKENN